MHPTTHRTHRARRAATALAAAALVPALVAGPAAAHGSHGSHDGSQHHGKQQGQRATFPSVIDLPDGFSPEGIATGRGARAYLGSLVDGDIYEVDLRTGEGSVISQGPGTPSVGLAVDRRNRLWVAGGPAGEARVVDLRTGEVLATYELNNGPSFVNDVVLTEDAAWFTDSQAAQLYRVPLAQDLAGQDAVETVPLTGEWEQVADDFNANGIARTPDGSALLVVQSATGFLFRVDPATGEATRVALGGYLLTNGDGLLTVGRTLYVVQNRMNKVAVLRLSADGTSGTLTRTITADNFDVPTTVARFGGSLYLPNARFGQDATEFSITRVRR